MFNLVPAAASSATNAGPSNDKWKAEAYANVELPVVNKKTGETVYRKVDSLKLTSKTKLGAILIKKFQEDPEGFGAKFLSKARINFQMADGSGSADIELEI